MTYKEVFFKPAGMQFSNWTDPVYDQLDQKDTQRLANKLKTYVNSTKFLRQGSKKDFFNQQTGVTQKRPLTNVTYYKQKHKNPLSAQKLQLLLRKAILQKDAQKLKQLSQYNYYTAQPALTPKEQLLQQQKHKKMDLASLALLMGLSGMAVGAGVPLLSRKLKGQTQNPKIQDIMKPAAAGGVTGLVAAGIINRFKG